ncbi:hypothetical protein EBB07_29235 [Paenibacillaceae bacterium]|nr:hypothetical protein EBB07_29235 [Paenibacillaceae bacterium]
MEPNLFKIIDDYQLMVANLYDKLVDKMNIDSEVVDELLNEFDEYSSNMLKLGRYTEEANVINKKKVISQDYDMVKKYTIFNIIYEYENGFSLGETTSGSLHLIPTEILIENS